MCGELFYGGGKNIDGGCIWLNRSLLCTWFQVVTKSVSQWLMSCNQSGCIWLNRSLLCTCFRFQAVEWSDRGWASVKCGEVGQQFICYLLCFSLYFIFFSFLLHQVTLPWSSLSAHSWRSQNQVLYLLVRWSGGQVAMWSGGQVVM